MYNRSKILALAVLLCLVFIPISEFVASIHSTTNDAVETNPKFVIASWDYPDEYWQGIKGINVYENSTGAWVVRYGTLLPADDTLFEWNVSVGIKLRVWADLNSTLVGVGTTAEGKNYLRHSVIVTQTNGSTIFSKQNFTYYGVSIEDEIYTYSYDVVLDFLPVNGEIYTVNINYEVFYLEASEDYEISEQSITSFGETLADDVLYYPDELNYDMTTCLESGNVTGGTETNTYASMVADDASNWRGSSSGSALYLYFTVGNLGDAESVDIHYEALSSSAGTDYIALYLDNPYGADLLIVNDTDAVSDAVISGYTTVTDFQDYAFNDVFTFYFYTTYKAPVTVIDADWFDIRTMTLADSNHYAESFSDVSDWTYASPDGSDSITSDGDLGIIVNDWAGGTDNDIVYCNTPSGSYGYYEIRYRLNTTSIGAVAIAGYAGANGGGANVYWKTLTKTTTWTTYKEYDIDSIESVVLVLQTNAVDAALYVDELRISPSTEMGWQHDGSTTIGITSSDGGTISTDGDNLTLTSDTDASSFEFAFDTTTTQASLRTAYYPFLVVNCTSVSEGDGWKLEQYDGSAWATLQSSYITTGGIYRYNMASLDTYVQKLRFNFTQTAIITFPFIKAYSIANYTYTGTGVSVDDVLYVSDGTLYCQATSITSMILDRDPALSVSTSLGDMWSITTSSGTPQTDYYVGAWAGYSSETEGDLAAGTLTDVRIKFTDSANIAAIIFLEHIAGWVTVTESVLYFQVPFDYWALNMGLIFGGLILMLLSTCIIAKKVRDKNISTDAGMILLLLFCVGWGLFIGGALL